MRIKYRWLDFQVRRQVNKEAKSEKRVQRITYEEQYKDNLRDGLRKDRGLDDMKIGAVHSGRFNTSKGYYLRQLSRKLPDSAFGYLYDKASTDGDAKAAENYLSELRYRDERRTAKTALKVSIVAATVSAFAAAVASAAVVLEIR